MNATDVDPERSLPPTVRLALLQLGGRVRKEPKRPGRRTKRAILEAAGWKLLPIPNYWAAGQLTHDPDTGRGNPGFIDFAHAREWLVIPADENAKAFKVMGPIAAIRAAWRVAVAAGDVA